MIKKLTEKQAIVLKCIIDAVRRKGTTPTCNEILEATGFKHHGSALHAIRRLEDRGYVKVTSGGRCGKHLEYVCNVTKMPKQPPRYDLESVKKLDMKLYNKLVRSAWGIKRCRSK
jgi:SOS-response transcriptional repressor LexA